MGKTYVRVDDRLIHGQTIVAWCPTLSIQEIIAIDDESAKNPILKSIMTMGVPSAYKTHIVTTEEAKEILSKESTCNRLVIVKLPSKLAVIEEEIVNAELIMLGNIAKRNDTIHKVSGATGIFYLSDNDVAIIDSLVSKGIEVCFHQLPNTTKTSWASFKKSI
jgi:mannose/fructose/N-acetylgalactosamine-specific phosphotransferase system component IIB